MRLAISTLLLSVACATAPVDGGTISVSDVTEFALVELDNGSQVQLRTGIVHFPDGITGLLVDYVTNHELGSEALQSEIPFVWWEAIPEVKRRSLSQGWVRALDRMPQGEFKAEGYRSCLAPDGSTLWLHLDGELTERDRAAGKRCL